MARHLNDIFPYSCNNKFQNLTVRNSTNYKLMHPQLFSLCLCFSYLITAILGLKFASMVSISRQIKQKRL